MKNVSPMKEGRENVSADAVRAGWNLEVGCMVLAVCAGAGVWTAAWGWHGAALVALAGVVGCVVWLRGMVLGQMERADEYRKQYITALSESKDMLSDFMVALSEAGMKGHFDTITGKWLLVKRSNGSNLILGVFASDASVHEGQYAVHVHDSDLIAQALGRCMESSRTLRDAVDVAYVNKQPCQANV